MQGGEEAAGAEKQRPLGQHRAPLVDPVQVAPRHVRHPDGPCGAVEELVPVSEKEMKRSRLTASHDGAISRAQTLICICVRRKGAALTPKQKAAFYNILMEKEA